MVEGLSMQASNVVQELLLLSSVRKAEVSTEPLDMTRLVTRAEFRLTYLKQEHGAEIAYPAAWPTARGYGPWVEEVWTNYISNGIKYGGDPPHLELGATLEGETIRFWVRDNGPGVPAGDRSRLFTPFTRLHQVRATGHGLGLSIVRRIVDKLGGQVGVESCSGQGSTFYFTLPAALEQEQLPARQAESMPV
jgi:signal transduction histidine kinase